MLDRALDYVRITLYTLLIIVGFLLFQAWNKDHPGSQPAAVSTESTVIPHFVPNTTSGDTPLTAASPSAVSTAPLSNSGSIVQVSTDVLAASIDTRGGDISEVKLLKYPETLDSKTPFLLLNDNADTRYIAESGLLSNRGPDTQQAQALYTAEKASYALSPDQNELTVTLSWHNNQGITVNKLFTFTRHRYEIKVSYQIINRSSQPWSGNLYTQLMRTNTPPATHKGIVNLTTYFGAAISTPEKPFEKITFKEMQEKSLNQTIQNGWVAMIQHYFISAWIPPGGAYSTYFSRVMPDGLYAIGMIGAPIAVAPGATITTQAKLYAGPAIAAQLEKVAPALKLTIDYGWFWFISGIIFWMMQKIYDVVGNWGWSIVLVTIIIKLLFYQLSAKSYRSMSGLKKLQPRIEILKERYGDDKQKLTQATLELYRQEKVNPMSGCLPILIQIPVFIALYWVLVESVQLRQAPFIFWIRDLSQHDPYYVLPVLMGISMFIQQRLNPPPPDPLQAKVMMLMPVIFTILFANFPSGLMLYWFVNNTLSFLQQWHVMRRLDNGKHAKR